MGDIHTACQNVAQSCDILKQGDCRRFKQVGEEILSLFKKGNGILSRKGIFF